MPITPVLLPYISPLSPGERGAGACLGTALDCCRLRGRRPGPAGSIGLGSYSKAPSPPHLPYISQACEWEVGCGVGSAVDVQELHAPLLTLTLTMTLSVP